MHNTIHGSTFAALLFLSAVSPATPGFAAGQATSAPKKAEHAVAGEVKKVDHAAKTVMVRTADGSEELLHFTDETTVHGVKGTAKAVDASAKAGLEGGSAVLHYVGTGANKTAVAIHHLGTGSVKMAKGTVVRVDEGGKFVVVKTEQGAEETFHLGKESMIESGKGLDHAAVASTHAIRKGSEVTVHYSDEAGKKLVHVLKHV